MAEFLISSGADIEALDMVIINYLLGNIFSRFDVRMEKRLYLRLL